MTHTGRIRLFLLFVAILPPLVIMVVLYQLTDMKQQDQQRKELSDSIDRFRAYHSIVEDRALSDFRNAITARPIQNAISLIKSNRSADAALTILPTGLDFVELVDSKMLFVASHHRPGLINEHFDTVGFTGETNAIQSALSTEYDVHGAHVALAFFSPAGDDMYLYGGRYLDKQYLRLSSLLMGSVLDIRFAQNKHSTVAAMTEFAVYSLNDSLQVRLLSDTVSGSYLVAIFTQTARDTIIGSLLITVSIVAALSALLALLLGFYLTGRTKREISNLVEATTRVAAGDFSTPVMAYEEGEFSELADSFSEMTLQLRNIRQRLSISEKIAAWQTMGRKIAHEIKNPLTPIAISADDLKASYQDNLPEFGKVLNETTGMIKSEVLRLSKLLDQFTAFARMNPPVIKQTVMSSIGEELIRLFRPDVDAEKLSIESTADLSIDVDPDQIRQLLINLVKNGLESNDDPKVIVTFNYDSETLLIEVKDNGRGFSESLINEGPQPYQTTKENGTGLGLIICQRIVHDHNGEMVLSNLKQGGGRVLIRLPQ